MWADISGFMNMENKYLIGYWNKKEQKYTNWKLSHYNMPYYKTDPDYATHSIKLPQTLKELKRFVRDINLLEQIVKEHNVILE